MRWPLVVGAMFTTGAVISGAFAAHGLKKILSPAMVEVFRTAADYQMIHGIGLILITLLSFHLKTRLLHWSAVLMTAGVMMFSGSLYALAMTGMKWLGPITPLGGVCFIFAWLLVMLAGIRSNQWQD